MEQLIDISILLAQIGALTVMTNLITEVVKKCLKTVPANLIAVIVAMALTIVTFIAWTNEIQMVVVWYHYVAAVVVGFMVAYAAMFGFDKLKETLNKLKS